MYAQYSCEAFEKEFTYPGNDLGSRWTRDRTVFRLWAPTATAAQVCLYRTGTDDLIQKLPMAPGEYGTWVAGVQGDWNGVYYTYLVSVNGNTVESCDPYAVAVGINGKRAMVCNLESTDPEGWEDDHTPVASRNYPDYAIYELHVRDASSLASSGIAHRGKFLGLAEPGTHLPSGQATGLDYIRQLGVTHVHLMPVFDFGSVDEANPPKSYNWGYDPANFNVPEGSYSTDPRNGFVRIREMKRMIQALHENGLGVVLDVVYNHVYHTMEFPVNRIVPGYFSRQTPEGVFSNGSFCGNDTASERSMVRKYIVDSVNFWAEEYHVDGFRFDLVGLLDTDTIREVISSVRQKHPHVLFYGEGWSLDTRPTKPDVSLAVQQNAWQLPDFAFFNDTLRDTLRGSIFDHRLPGYVSGAAVPRQELLQRFQGRTAWSCQPSQIVNYVSCHDDHTLHDRIALALPQADESELARRCRLAAAFNILSTGIPFFQAGEEMLRSKKSGPGKYIGNSYRSGDRINGIKWNRLREPEVHTTVRYYQGLLSLRKKHPLFRMTDPEQVLARITLLDDAPQAVAAFRLEDETETIVAAFNPGGDCQSLSLPGGTWEVFVRDSSADGEPLDTVSGEAVIPPISAFVAMLRK